MVLIFVYFVCSILYTKIKTAKIWTCVNFFLSHVTFDLYAPRHMLSLVAGAKCKPSLLNGAFLSILYQGVEMEWLSDPSGLLSASISPATIKMLVLPHTAHTTSCACAQSPAASIRNSKIQKFILRVFWSIIRKLAPMKISCYTVGIDLCRMLWWLPSRLPCLLSL